MSWGGQGQSRNTMLKNQCLKNVVDSIIDKSYYASLIYPEWITRDSPFVILDLNCGSGYNDQYRCVGSPLIFINSILRSSICQSHFKLGFVDRDSNSISILRERSEVNLPIVNIQDASDNSEWLDTHGHNFIGNSSLGFMYTDPNGATIPLESMSKIAKSHLQLDIVIHLSATVIKRNNGAYGVAHTKTLRNIIDIIPRDHWYIRRNNTKWQWIMLVGQSIPCKLDQLLGFYDLYSSEGQDILNYVS